MESFKNSSMLSLPQELGLKLQQLTVEFPIENIFFHPATSEEHARIIIISADTKNTEVIAARKWIKKAEKEYPVLFHSLGSIYMQIALKRGNPFVPVYCNQSAIIYQNPSSEFLSASWKGFKKRYKKFEYEYYHDCDILLSNKIRFYEQEAQTSVFLTYSAIFEYHLQYLERLYTGHCFISKDIHQSIKHLAKYTPSIEDFLVEQDCETYFLVNQLAKAKEAAEQGDEMYINYALYDAVREVEEHLHAMVSNRLEELKNRMKEDKTTNSSSSLPTFPAIENELSAVVAQIMKIKNPEEIYLFQKIQTASATTYYLLLIGKGLGTETLNTMQHAVTVKFKGACSVVLIGHSRMWIQTNLFIHQDFFKTIMTAENRIFHTPHRNFTMHWEKPHQSYYDELDYRYESTNKMISQYFVLRQNAEEENTEGLTMLFSAGLLRMFRSFIYAKLSYEINYLSAYNLWMLCLYAKPNMAKKEYLFQKLGGDTFFKEVDRIAKSPHRLSLLSEEKLLIIDEILNALTKELKTACEIARQVDK